MIFLKYLGVSKAETNWFWESWSRPLGPKNMQTWGFPASQKCNRKVNYWSKTKQNNSTELLGQTFNKVCSKNCIPEPPRSQMRIFPGFPGFSIGDRFVFCVLLVAPHRSQIRIFLGFLGFSIGYPPFFGVLLVEFRTMSHNRRLHTCYEDTFAQCWLAIWLAL